MFVESGIHLIRDSIKYASFSPLKACISDHVYSVSDHVSSYIKMKPFGKKKVMLYNLNIWKFVIYTSIKLGGGWKNQTIWFSSNLYSNKGFSNCILSILKDSRKVLRANILKAEEVSPWVSHCQINYPSHILIRASIYNFIWEKKTST